MKKILIAFYFLIFFFMLSGCATVFSPRSQDITIKSNKPFKLRVDSVFVGEGKEIKSTVKKDWISKQINIEIPGYKKENYVIFQDRKSLIHILSWIPFGIMIFPPIYDLAPNTWNFEDEYTFNEPLQKYPVWDSTQKKIDFRSVSFDIKKADNVLNIFTLYEFNNNYLPGKTITQDSINFKHTIFEDNLSNVLKKLQFIDTSNTVFIDNLNTIGFRCKIDKISINNVGRPYIGPIRSEFYQSEIRCDWVIEDIYGDTLHRETIESQSGTFAGIITKPELAITSSISDAIEISMLKFMEKSKVKDVLKYDSISNIKFENLVIKSPEKSPSEIEQAMTATVTIKSTKGHGSGFVISNDGYIITNHHVVCDKQKYTVVTSDGKEYEAKLIRQNKGIDLALLKIDGNFEYAFKIPQSKNYKIGQNIFAIGTPKTLELGQSVSKGVVSNIRKHKDYNFIQSDVSVNRGNSGGPIVNEKGDLISIVEWKVFGIGTEGISFSIPAEDIMKSLSLSY